MKLIVTINIEEDEYKRAICHGWYDRFGKAINPENVQTLYDIGDFIGAVPHMSEDDFTDIGVVK